LDCGTEDRREYCIGVHPLGCTVAECQNGPCPEPNSRRHDPYYHPEKEVENMSKYKGNVTYLEKECGCVEVSAGYTQPKVIWTAWCNTHVEEGLGQIVQVAVPVEPKPAKDPPVELVRRCVKCGGDGLDRDSVGQVLDQECPDCDEGWVPADDGSSVPVDESGLEKTT